MSELRRYRRKAGAQITAVQLELDTDGFSYRKWGSDQACKPGDWIVNNDGDVYTIDRETFAQTYKEVGPGRYAKTVLVWAEQAKSPGVIETKEGETHYGAGDYLVYNDAERRDGYAMKAETFHKLYEQPAIDSPI